MELINRSEETVKFLTNDTRIFEDNLMHFSCKSCRILHYHGLASSGPQLLVPINGQYPYSTVHVAGNNNFRTGKIPVKESFCGVMLSS
jgi:hypothetical protein